MAWIILTLLLLVPIFFLFYYKNTSISNKAFFSKFGPISIVLGASEGLGAEYAKSLAAKGLSVLLVARNQSKLETFAQELQNEHKDVKVYTLALDLSNTDKLVESLEEGFTKHGIKKQEIGLVIYNAAYSPLGFVLEKGLKEQLTGVSVNVIGVITLSYYFGKLLSQRENGGGLILMSSMIGTIGTAGLATYSSTKNFISTFSQGLWLEYQKYKINVLCPIIGSTRTPGYLKNTKTENESWTKKILEQTPEEVVAEVLSVLPHTNTNGPWIITGYLNKFLHFFVGRVLPKKFAIEMISDTVQKQVVPSTNSAQ